MQGKTDNLLGQPSEKAGCFQNRRESEQTARRAMLEEYRQRKRTISNFHPLEKSSMAPNLQLTTRTCNSTRVSLTSSERSLPSYRSSITIRSHRTSTRLSMATKPMQSASLRQSKEAIKPSTSARPPPDPRPWRHNMKRTLKQSPRSNAAHSSCNNESSCVSLSKSGLKRTTSKQISSRVYPKAPSMAVNLKAESESESEWKDEGPLTVAELGVVRKKNRRPSGMLQGAASRVIVSSSSAILNKPENEALATAMSNSSSSSDEPGDQQVPRQIVFVSNKVEERRRSFRRKSKVIIRRISNNRPSLSPSRRVCTARHMNSFDELQQVDGEVEAYPSEHNILQTSPLNQENECQDKSSEKASDRETDGEISEKCDEFSVPDGTASTLVSTLGLSLGPETGTQPSSTSYSGSVYKNGVIANASELSSQLQALKTPCRRLKTPDRRHVIEMLENSLLDRVAAGTAREVTKPIQASTSFDGTLNSGTNTTVGLVDYDEKDKMAEKKNPLVTPARSVQATTFVSQFTQTTPTLLLLNKKEAKEDVLDIFPVSVSRDTNGLPPLKLPSCDKYLQVINPKTGLAIQRERIPTRPFELFSLQDAIRISQLADEAVARAVFEIVGAPRPSGLGWRRLYVTDRAEYWIERANFERRVGRLEEAVRIYEKAWQRKVVPIESLKTAWMQFVQECGYQANSEMLKELEALEISDLRDTASVTKNPLGANKIAPIYGVGHSEASRMVPKMDTTQGKSLPQVTVKAHSEDLGMDESEKSTLVSSNEEDQLCLPATPKMIEQLKPNEIALSGQFTTGEIIHTPPPSILQNEVQRNEDVDLPPQFRELNSFRLRRRLTGSARRVTFRNVPLPNDTFSEEMTEDRMTQDLGQNLVSEDEKESEKESTPSMALPSTLGRLPDITFDESPVTPLKKDKINETFYGIRLPEDTFMTTYSTFSRVIATPDEDEDDEDENGNDDERDNKVPEISRETQEIIERIERDERRKRQLASVREFAELIRERYGIKKESTTNEKEENEAKGSRIRYAAITPSRRLRNFLQTDVVMSPVRRSARIATKVQPLGDAENRAPVAAEEELCGGELQRRGLDSIAQVSQEEYAFVPNRCLEVRIASKNTTPSRKRGPVSTSTPLKSRNAG
ncbi:uncharacterized protein VTP21DRAFT_230 [Calcarisporiella thermophila]|uniref:uncharacterized protein n=1 Tax=Calcarisporiella thermophila TaxID=911321 RepID=UPI0037439CA9